MEYNGNKKKNRAFRNTQNIISIIFLSLVSLLALSFCIFILLRNASLLKENEAFRSELDELNTEGYYTKSQAQELVDSSSAQKEKETRQSILDQIQNNLESGKGTNYTFRSLFADQLVVTDAGKYYFFPINQNIPHNSFSETDFALDDSGIMHYQGKDGSVKGELGIDVSRFQGDIDWKKVAAAGVKYAFIRVGSRGSSKGKIVLDDHFTVNAEGALANGIQIGVYIYSQAVNDAEALEEAKFVLDTIEPYQITCPVVFDLEKADQDQARTEKVTQDQFTRNAQIFCDTVKGAGYAPMIYGNLKSYTLLLDLTKLTAYDKWIAYYNVPQYFPYEFSVWQYASEGKIDGIEGKVDLNINVKDW